MYISREYAVLKRNYLVKQIEPLPSGHIVIERNKYKQLYISSYPGKKEMVHKRFTLSKQETKDILSLIERRESLEKELQSIELFLQSKMPDIAPKPYPFLDREFYALLEPHKDSNPVPKNQYAPEFEGTRFRSKSELSIAQLLSGIGLKYIYEPEYALTDKLSIYPDFVVDVPEIDRCFVIEHFGMMSDGSYQSDAEWKMHKYLDNGFLPGRDILFTYEANQFPLDIDVVRQQINALILANSQVTI
ncbi:MAG: hypothetical protein K6A80_05255 [Saccharofermentans sp.]|nr:hypothetical protein [Saccharofermentans sp.]